jgi:hypothetical protein
MFFPLDIRGLLLGIGEIAAISWFLISARICGVLVHLLGLDYAEEVAIGVL